MSAASLLAAGIIRNLAEPVKVLGHGDISRALVIRGLPISASARAKIEAAGGKVEA